MEITSTLGVKNHCVLSCSDAARFYFGSWMPHFSYFNDTYGFIPEHAPPFSPNTDDLMVTGHVTVDEKAPITYLFQIGDERHCPVMESSDGQAISIGLSTTSLGLLHTGKASSTWPFSRFTAWGRCSLTFPFTVNFHIYPTSF